MPNDRAAGKRERAMLAWAKAVLSARVVIPAETLRELTPEDRELLEAAEQLALRACEVAPTEDDPEVSDVPVHMGSVAWDLGFRASELAHELSGLTEVDAANTNRAISAVLPGTPALEANLKRYTRAYALLVEVADTLLGHQPWDKVDRAFEALTKQNLDPAALRLRQGPALEACDAAIRAWPAAGSLKQRMAIAAALNERLHDCDLREFSKLTASMVFEAFEQAEAGQPHVAEDRKSDEPTTAPKPKRPPKKRTRKLRANYSRPKLLLAICQQCGAWPHATVDTLQKK